MPVLWCGGLSLVSGSLSWPEMGLEGGAVGVGPILHCPLILLILLYIYLFVLSYSFDGFTLFF
jgi:hypothetical protein